MKSAVIACCVFALLVQSSYQLRMAQKPHTQRNTQTRAAKRTANQIKGFQSALNHMKASVGKEFDRQMSQLERKFMNMRTNVFRELDIKDESKDKCKPSPCLYGGKCIAKPYSKTGFVCRCQEGFTGMTCRSLNNAMKKVFTGFQMRQGLCRTYGQKDSECDIKSCAEKCTKDKKCKGMSFSWKHKKCSLHMYVCQKLERTDDYMTFRKKEKKTPPRYYNKGQCHGNQTFTRCKACDSQCQNGKVEPTMCNRMCRPGCSCTKGYIRLTANKCIKKYDCKPARYGGGANTKQCGANAKFQTCGSAESCVPKCVNGKLDKGPGFCVMMCNQGCYCNKGYIKNQYGKCISLKSCSGGTRTTPPPAKANRCKKYCPSGQKCVRKEVYCFRAPCPAQETCVKAAAGGVCASNPCKHGGTCISRYSTFTCMCAAGWKGTTCQTYHTRIRFTTLPPIRKTCGVNETWTEWGECGIDCSNFDWPSYKKPMCGAVRMPHCMCKSGYYRNTSKRCVSAADCKKKDGRKKKSYGGGFDTKNLMNKIRG